MAESIWALQEREPKPTVSTAPEAMPVRPRTVQTPFQDVPIATFKASQEPRLLEPATPSALPPMPQPESSGMLSTAPAPQPEASPGFDMQREYLSALQDMVHLTGRANSPMLTNADIKDLNDRAQQMVQQKLQLWKMTRPEQASPYVNIAKDQLSFAREKFDYDRQQDAARAEQRANELKLKTEREDRLSRALDARLQINQDRLEQQKLRAGTEQEKARIAWIQRETEALKNSAPVLRAKAHAMSRWGPDYEANDPEVIQAMAAAIEAQIPQLVAQSHQLFPGTVSTVAPADGGGDFATQIADRKRVNDETLLKLFKGDNVTPEMKKLIVAEVNRRKGS